MLEQAVTRLRDRGLPAPSVLDVGCGSGVLCVAARLLGAGDILGLDVDPPALDECARNALLNETAFRASLVPVEDLEGSWDVVLANILPAPLVALAPHLVARTSPGGLLILSGVLASDEGFPKRFLEACEGRMAFLEQRTHEGWWAGLLVSAMRP
ncbi:MAG: 50S ribosomal protein L11 methyltransferase, partial [Deltaproteobacteria bacterium]|nr:50S ribosomal protein L11 methyltransferase [Deltaproteobacteria bacterium]